MTVSHITIDRQRVIDTFAAYVSNYDSGNTKVRLKIEHTYRVAGLCQAIGKSIGLTGSDLDIAWLTGMLHDVGRFEQLRRYNTFYDDKSVLAVRYCLMMEESGIILMMIVKMNL